MYLESEKGSCPAEASPRCCFVHSLDSSGEPERPDARGSEAQGVHVGHVLDGMVEGFHIITFQGELGLRGVHMNLQQGEKTMLRVLWQIQESRLRKTQRRKVGEQARFWETRLRRRVEETHASWAGGHTFIPLPRLSKSL